VSNPSIIVLTNDDGIEAPGLASLRLATDDLSNRRVLAPSGPQSGCGHRVTTHQVIAIDHRGEDMTAVGGTPADCVRVAIHFFGSNVAWVLSGINAGGNLGVDVHHSGTVAAVREAAIHGIPGIAISHYIARGREVDWDQAARWTAGVLRFLMAHPPEAGTFWNVNLPHPEPGGPEPEMVYCQVDPSPMALAFREESGGLVYDGNYQRRPRQPSKDVDVCFGGQIAVSKVQVISSVSAAELV
jgi:5'-nucleotidase